MTVITGEELRASHVRQVGDALRSLPGISVSRSGGSGNLTDVRIRGAENNHTLVLIDGIEANTTTNGAFDFSDLSTDNIERIEVIRGPLSGIYGSNAVGGVINIITRKGQGPLALTLQTGIGSLATRETSARLSGGNDRANLSVAYHWLDTNGFNVSPQGSEDDGMRLRSFSLKGGVRILENLSVDLALRQIDKRADRDGFGDPSAPFGSIAASFDEASALRDKIFLAGTTVRWDTFDGRLTHEFRATHNDTSLDDKSSSFHTLNLSEADTFGYVATYRLDTPAIWGKHTLTALAESGKESFTPKGDLTDGIERGRDRVSYAAEWRGEFANRLFLTAGVRHDDNDTFEDFTTWRSALSYKEPGSAWRPHASVGTAVKVPTMFEQFGSIPLFFTPNPDLAPEESRGWDAGIEYTFARGRAVLDVTYFHAELENKIDGFAPGPMGTFTAVNLPGTSTRQGIEIAGRFKLLANVGLGLSYTYLDARDPDGSREQRRPPHMARADIDYSFAGGRGTVRLSTVYNGEIIDRAPYEIGTFINRPQTVGDYWVVNAAASYKLQPGVELFARVENLFDQRYQEVYGYQAAPITAFAGLKLTFGGKDGLGGGGSRAK